MISSSFTNQVNPLSRNLEIFAAGNGGGAYVRVDFLFHDNKETYISAREGRVYYYKLS